jgi:N-acylglucosamine-6-phosphate 2-epimerase
MELLDQLRGGLIVSCQAPPGSPLENPQVIAAMAAAAERAGAAGVRINGPANVQTVRAAVKIPIIGIYKRRGQEIVITPTFEDAQAVREAGADLIALDATGRARAADLIRRVQSELLCPVMADIATAGEGRAAAQAGASLIATTLYGYTSDTSDARLPGLDLVEALAGVAGVVCEGGVASPEQVAEAFRRGAFAVAVGTAITGIEARVRMFASACNRMK